jgi:hypothetical protein
MADKVRTEEEHADKFGWVPGQLVELSTVEDLLRLLERVRGRLLEPDEPEQRR